jgi:hypothetical protein
MELKSVKTQSDTRLTQIEKRFENRLNQIENRFAHLEGHQNKPASRERYDNDNDDDYYYGPDY